jgi:Asp-tRNA(Asn)/Glu-tRNA(Gln) amidotransferase A subunit family amidase
MSGRIKLLSNGEPVVAEDLPTIEYAYDQPGEFDKECGTFNLDSFQLPNTQCPDRFVCDADTASPSVQAFSKCIDAMNCHMFDGMTTGIKADDPRVLFVHQMVPHHQNAVNMAKALLKTNTLQCDDVRNEDVPDCVMLKIMYDIINQQNHQIQEMYNYVDALGSPRTDNCDVEVTAPAISSATNSRRYRKRRQLKKTNNNIQNYHRRVMDTLEDVVDIATHTGVALGKLLL